VKVLDDPDLCTLMAPCSACRLLPPSCILKLWLVLPTPSRARQEYDRSVPFESVGELPVSKMLPDLDPVSLFGPFMPTYLSLELHHVVPPLSNLHLCYLLHVFYLSNEACAHRVRVDCYVFTESSLCRRSFFDRATPVILCSIVICMLIDCLLHQFLGSI